MSRFIYDGPLGAYFEPVNSNLSRKHSKPTELMTPKKSLSI